MANSNKKVQAVSIMELKLKLEKANRDLQTVLYDLYEIEEIVQEVKSIHGDGFSF